MFSSLLLLEYMADKGELRNVLFSFLSHLVEKKQFTQTQADSAYDILTKEEVGVTSIDISPGSSDQYVLGISLFL